MASSPVMLLFLWLKTSFCLLNALVTTHSQDVKIKLWEESQWKDYLFGTFSLLSPLSNMVIAMVSFVQLFQSFPVDIMSKYTLTLCIVISLYPVCESCVLYCLSAAWFYNGLAWTHILQCSLMAAWLAYGIFHVSEFILTIKTPQ